MDIKVLKNVLQNIIHFLDAEKHIDIQNDSWNNLDLFLIEFNRYRKMLGLPEYQFEKRMPMLGRGDWFGRGEKIRFIPQTKASTLRNVSQSESTVSFPETQKITKAKITEILKSTYEEDLEIRNKKQDEELITLFFSNGVPVGSWSKGQGWYLT